MKILLNTVIITLLILSSCTKEEEETTIQQGDYPVKEYYLERDPKVNVWGAGMDFVNDSCTFEETTLDYEYLTEDNDFPLDVKFYTVKAYYYDDQGDLQSEGCPAMLISQDAKGCKVGAGVDFFDSLTVVTEDMVAELEVDHKVNYSNYIDDETGYYDRTSLFASIDSCIIGRCFRSNVLEIPDDKTEEEVQPVFLIETTEGGYAKFMVKQFKGDAPNQKQTLVRWQVITE